MLDTVETGLGHGPFLEGRDEPGRGDLAGASSVVQVGYKDSMPDLARRTLQRPQVLEHARRVFDACSTEQPRWLKASAAEAVTSTSA